MVARSFPGDILSVVNNSLTAQRWIGRNPLVFYAAHCCAFLLTLNPYTPMIISSQQLTDRLAFLERCQTVLAQVKYRDWNFRLEAMGDGAFVQVQFVAPCAENGTEEMQYGRKWYLSPHMSNSEIVQSALLACKIALEHELREEFTYQNRPIFHPHYSLEDLVHHCDNVPRDRREEHTNKPIS